ncbi:anti-sigma factor domain-containing protein [Robiginitalea sp. SC105]|uniref:anti-sigma factor n=1 Tax=Robiginitalea sp. SC105 TaxID=2762332 RepID=UPI00163979B9|nr:anti-sigma factor [Robiginitalea sp. SC105]MBC2839077.1 anti-sigma factor [Robiginitalea sp. SC105]
MKDKIRQFLESDLLEQYLLDATSAEDSARVEQYIAMYPEVRDTYLELQENLEAYAKLHAVKAPDGLRERILHRVRKERAGRRRFLQYAVAASIAAIFAVGASFWFYNQNMNLRQENDLVNNKIRVLEADMKEQLEDVRNQFIVLNNPGTRKFMVNGNQKARELKAIAYVNPVKKLSYINVRNLPNLPEDKDYQMWAEVNGEMVNLGVIRNFEDKEKLMALPYGEKSLSYITIEPKGGNTTPTVQNIVADFSY